MANNRATAMRFLLDKGLTRPQAAGVVGSLMQESGLRPDAKNPSSGALGIGQWLGGRKTNLLNSGNSGLRGQLDFLWSELQGPEKAALTRLKGAHSVADAVNAFTWGFERPGRAEANIPNRVNQAHAALGLRGGGDGGGDAATTPTHLAFDPGTAQIAQTTLPERPQRQISAPPLPSFAARAVTPEAPTTTAQIAQMPQTPQTAAPRFDAATALGALGALQRTGGTATTSAETKTPDSTSTKPVTEAKGVGKFDGKAVAKWIEPILDYARAQGWKGSINSGYRTLADQTRIYNSGVRPAAKPGTSNHEFTAFPGGAVDVSDAQTLSNILRRSKYAKALVWAGGKDPVHFSHPHGGSY
jgi:hypothetical protein